MMRWPWQTREDDLIRMIDVVIATTNRERDENKKAVEAMRERTFTTGLDE